MKYELYLHQKQKEDYILGTELYKHLKKEKILDRCLSLDSELVKEWIENPDTYPEELTYVFPYLWGSVRDLGSRREVAYLLWHDGCVVVLWRWLGSGWDGNDQTLLASSLTPETSLEQAIEICKKAGLVVYEQK
jgi:hypothetical protein